MWIVSPQGNVRGQTQLAASTNCNAPWNHPLDIHFAARSPLGWPKLVLQVQELDEVCMIYDACLQPYSYTVARMFSPRGLWILSSSSHTGLLRAFRLLLETDWLHTRWDICIFPGNYIKINKLRYYLGSGCLGKPLSSRNNSYWKGSSNEFSQHTWLVFHYIGNSELECDIEEFWRKYWYAPALACASYMNLGFAKLGQ